MLNSGRVGAFGRSVSAVALLTFALVVFPVRSRADDNAAPSLTGVVALPGDTTPPTDSKTKTLCFDLLPVQKSKLQPYYLFPDGDQSHFPGLINKCAKIDEKHPLLKGDKIAVGIYADKNDWYKVELLNLNITAPAATPLNPAPVRATVTLPQINYNVLERQYQTFYIKWPSPLAGDTVPEITVKALYYSQAEADDNDDSDATGKKENKPQSKRKATKDQSKKPVGETKPENQEELISIWDETYPQIHNPSYFNIATGVVGSTLHNPTFSRVQTSAQVGQPSDPNFVAAHFATQRTANDPVIAPVLMFTVYVRPFDAERSWHPKDLIPEPSIGFSLTSPADDFFFGASTEIFRHVQAVAGLHVGKVNELASVPFDDPTSNAAPLVNQEFHLGFYGGLTFNIDFIKGLFGGK